MVFLLLICYHKFKGATTTLNGSFVLHQLFDRCEERKERGEEGVKGEDEEGEEGQGMMRDGGRQGEDKERDNLGEDRRGDQTGEYK